FDRRSELVPGCYVRDCDCFKEIDESEINIIVQGKHLLPYKFYNYADELKIHYALEYAEIWAKPVPLQTD
ncbi:9174_t:CDS:2, partial [Rhizophagus irregularis]